MWIEQAKFYPQMEVGDGETKVNRWIDRKIDVVWWEVMSSQKTTKKIKEKKEKGVDKVGRF